jgi:predicted PurR-regulated permease PerM
MMEASDAPRTVTAGGAGSGASRLRAALDRRADWIEALVVLATFAVGFVVLDFLARYFQDYFHLILIFFLAWLLAFLISPVADWIQRRLKHVPRAIAVIGVIVPVIIIGALIAVRVVASLADSFVQLAAALPGLVANPPSFLNDVQAWFNARGIDVDVVGAFESAASGLLSGLTDFVLAAFGGALSAVGVLVDAIVILTLAIFMAIDRDSILRLGLDITPPEKREDVLLFRQSIGSAFAGFIRSQLYLGALYGLWAFLVSFVFGLPFGPATAFLSGLFMAIPIYGPYVSWLPPVLVAFFVRPDIVVVVAIVMLVGWFIDENILAPLVRAGALQLHPIVITFAFLLGAQLAGAIGAIVAIPLAAVVQAFVVKYFEQYRADRGWPPPDATPNAPPAPPGDQDATTATATTGEAPGI